MSGEHGGQPFPFGRRESEQHGGQLVEPVPFVSPFAFVAAPVGGDGAGGRIAGKCVGFCAALRANPRIPRGIRGSVRVLQGTLSSLFRQAFFFLDLVSRCKTITYIIFRQHCPPVFLVGEKWANNRVDMGE